MAEKLFIKLSGTTNYCIDENANDFLQQSEWKNKANKTIIKYAIFINI